ncbi:MAG TPA: FCD domain-containing protein, partial [Microlunatus sp.]|nr:FCD domain-containing protein [Microlunatus sp.]
SILQARQAIAPAVAAHAAETAGAAAAEALRAAVTELEQAPDSERRQHAALVFWDAVVDAADSIVFRLLFNSLRLAYEPAIAALGPVMDAEVDNIGGYRVLADAIAAGDRAAAQAAADELLRPATEALSRLLALLDT